jgi:hypothetical protein
MSSFVCPLLFQFNTRVCLQELSCQLGRPATLKDIPDDLLDFLEAQGFNWFWSLGVWTTGSAGREISRTNPVWREEYQKGLPDFEQVDICGSPFAICAYEVHPDFGGRDALADLRQRLAQRGVRLMTDFVPNHTAQDHPWVSEHPEYYIHGSEPDLDAEPHNYVRVMTNHGPRVLAHGKDPCFNGWVDTLQLNYRCKELQEAQRLVLQSIAEQCDGVRCDMAMLLLPDIIARTWGSRAVPADGVPSTEVCFWPWAIESVRGRNTGFVFMAEVYWDLEWELQQQGFDFTYDKWLYDRLLSFDSVAVREHLKADPEFQQRSCRFLENHDEPRVASVLSLQQHLAAAAITFLSPGLRLFHEGQSEGRKHRVSMHLARRASETPDSAIQDLYKSLLGCLRSKAFRQGTWFLLECLPEWEANPTFRQFVSFAWESSTERWLICVNYGPGSAQTFVKLWWADLGGRKWTLQDQLTAETIVREGNDLAERGLYFNVPAWRVHVFLVKESAGQAL